MSPDLERLAAALSHKYRIEGELGTGGMAMVYLAEDVKHHRTVAIKVLRPELAVLLGPRRFLKEIETVAKLNHPHILGLHDSGEIDGFLYYVMPVVQGESLRARLNAVGRLSIDEAMHVAGTVSSALEYAHRHGIIHRDIKPENILLHEGVAMVTDFGIALEVSPKRGERLTTAGFSLGTPAYMSPEQATGERILDPRSDVYSLGCVVYEMLVGDPPFDGDSMQAVIAKHLTEPVPSITDARQDAPPHLAAAITKSLGKAPEDRFSTAREFADALHGQSAGSFERPVPISPTTAGVWYTCGALGAFGVVYLTYRLLGLPNWMLPAAIAVLIVGFPVVVATALAARKTGVERHRVRFWTWKKAVTGGTVTFGLLAVLSMGQMISRSAGIGPWATLLGQGIVHARDKVVIADFEDPSGDPLLADAVTEAFRIDWSQSRTIRPLSTEHVIDVLRLMEQSSATRVNPTIAAEIAVREGASIVLTGNINRLGNTVIVSARLTNPQNGEELITDRETARTQDELIDAVDALSKRLLSRIGGSFKSLQANAPLPRRTTSSLDALVKYSTALRFEATGECAGRCVPLYEEAVALDTTFVAAHRKLGVSLLNIDLNRSRHHIERAYTFRNRATERERYLTEYFYFRRMDEDRAEAALLSMLELNPEDWIALNELGIEYLIGRDPVQAEVMYQRAFDAQSDHRLLDNLTGTQIGLGKLSEAAQNVERLKADFPAVGTPYLRLAQIAYLQNRFEEAIAHIDEYLAQKPNPDRADWGEIAIALLNTIHGKQNAANEYFDKSIASFERRGLVNPIRSHTAWRSMVDAVALDSPESARNRMDVVLQRWSLDSVPANNLLRLKLAALLAFVGQPDRARAMLAQTDRSWRDEYDRAWVMGRILIADGHPRAAIDTLTVLTRHSANALTTLGQAYELVGEPDSAIAAYEQFDAAMRFGRSAIEHLESHAVWRPWVYRRLGELHEARGDSRSAMDYYARYVDLYEDADPVLQPPVEDARHRIAQLSREGAPR